MKNFQYLFVLLLIFSSSTFQAQVDVGSWTSFSLNYKANDKLVLTAKPIARHVSDLSKYSDTSIDFILNYKINSAWSGTLLNRHFFIPDGGDRQFWFIDLNYKFPIVEKITFANKLRYHLAVNWNRDDTDFIRYHPNFSFKTKSRITPFVGMELFYRITDVRVLSGGRYVAGFHLPFKKKFKLTLQYWRQAKFDDENHPLGESHIILTNIAYNLN